VPVLMKEIDNHGRKIIQGARDQVVKVDVAELSPEMRARQERNVIRGSFMAAYLKQGKKEGRKAVAPYKPERPALPPGKGVKQDTEPLGTGEGR